MSQRIKVTFLHPRGTKEFEAEMGSEMTGEQTVAGLIKYGFLDKDFIYESYELCLMRNGRSLTLRRSLASSGVRDGDVVDVVIHVAGCS